MKLPWYYLGDISTIVYGLSPRVRDAKCVAKALAMLTTRSSAAKATKPTAGGAHPLLTYVTQVIAPRVKEDFRWTPAMWPEKVEIRVRSNFPSEFKMVSNGGTQSVKRVAEDFIIGPSKVVFSWPFDGLTDPEGKLEKLFQVEPFKLEADYDPGTDTLGDPLLAAGDDFATGDAAGQMRPSESDPSSMLVARATQHLGRPDFGSYSLPNNVTVSPEKIPTTGSWIECTDTQVILHLGVPHTKEEKSLDGKGMDDDNGFYAEWPCGAFGT